MRNATHHTKLLPAASVCAAPARELKTVSSQELLGACGELVIRHLGREYHLRITQNGKLILTA